MIVGGWLVGTGEVEEGKYCRQSVPWQSVGAIKGALSALRGQFLAESTFRVMPVYYVLCRLLVAVVVVGGGGDVHVE